MDSTSPSEQHSSRQRNTLEEEELGKARFMELLSNCGVFQKASELILNRVGCILETPPGETTNANPRNIPQIQVPGLSSFLSTLQTLTPELLTARTEITTTGTVSFYPGLGELFLPGSKLICHPEGMEGTPLGVSCIQSWYTEEVNRATGKLKRRFIMAVEFLMSVGSELVFVAASEVYPEFHDERNIPIKDLNHRRLDLETTTGNGSNVSDGGVLDRLQARGEFYARVSTRNHYLQYHPNSFYPIRGLSRSASRVARPLSTGGRVMVDVTRGIVEGHIPIRGGHSGGCGVSDTVKEAIKLFDQSSRTGVAVPFRTCLYKPGKGDNKEGETDRGLLWMAWPILTGFSFTARVWGKLLLSLPPPAAILANPTTITSGHTGNCGTICFQERAFDQLVLADDKKELIRAVARNAGGSSDDEDEGDTQALDFIANKGGASIFLLHGPPGCGKTLTAEAIAELLQKPLYIVTAGDLGVTAQEVEQSLGSVLDLCQTWDALVLIDEADVFLETRSSLELQRNALVCVMLRLLEYYSGCLFLSSNRSAERIDDAIASRITVMLGYPALDEVGREQVWKNLIELVPTQPVSTATTNNTTKSSRYRLEFTPQNYKALANGYDLNGRQIKNSIVLARALSRERKLPLDMTILHRAVMAVAGEKAKAKAVKPKFEIGDYH